MTVKSVAQKIRDLRIQGATNIAVEGLKSLIGTREKDLERSMRILQGARPNEPMLFNGLNYVKATHREGSISESVNEYVMLIKEAKSRAIETCAERIRDGTVMTHCHSSLVVESIIRAKRDGKKVKAIVTETRPLYQGRISARELAAAKVPVAFAVDSAAKAYMNDCDLFLVGSDVITANSQFVNKIGTALMALAAKEANTEVGIVAQLLKVDARTIRGGAENIEQRGAKEVWDRAPKGVKIENPAFDMTPANYVNFLATEFGMISPYTAFQVVQQKYPWIMEGVRWY